MRLVPPLRAVQGDGDAGVTNRRAVAPVRATPIALLPRAHRHHWRALQPVPDAGDAALTPPARRVVQALQAGGALFFSDLIEASGLLRAQVEEALSELSAWGLVTCDTFAGLRALVQPRKRRRPAFAPRGRRRRPIDDVDSAGRWVLTQGATVGVDDRERLPGTQTLEHVAGILLLRYGVVFRDLLEREAGLPPWRRLLYVYRRLEARGEIRGGRFVAGFGGEQFALPDAVGALRNARRQVSSGDELVSVSAADPLNLLGIVTPGERLAALPGNRLLYRGGVPIACLAAGEVRFLEPVAADERWMLRQHLLRHRESGTALPRVRSFG